MNEGNEASQSEGVVRDFSRRMAGRPKKEAQMGMGGGDDLGDLFKPEIGGDKPDMKMDKPPGLDDELGEGLDEEKSEADKIRDHIDGAELSVDELDGLADYITEKRVEMTEDDYDTEMNRGEAEGKDHMKKDRDPLGGESMNGAPMSGGSMGAAPRATGAPM